MRQVVLVDHLPLNINKLSMSAFSNLKLRPITERIDSSQC